MLFCLSRPDINYLSSAKSVIHKAQTTHTIVKHLLNYLFTPSLTNDILTKSQSYQLSWFYQISYPQALKAISFVEPHFETIYFPVTINAFSIELTENTSSVDKT